MPLCFLPKKEKQTDRDDEKTITEQIASRAALFIHCAVVPSGIGVHTVHCIAERHKFEIQISSLLTRHIGSAGESVFGISNFPFAEFSDIYGLRNRQKAGAG